VCLPQRRQWALPLSGGSRQKGDTALFQLKLALCLPDRMYHCCSGASGYLLPLSGGADSSSTAAIVGAMAQMVVNAAAGGDPQALADARRCVFKDRDVRPSYAFVHAALTSSLALPGIVG